MPYADLNTIQTYNPGDILTAAAIAQVRTNQEFFIDPPACSVYNSAVQSIPNATSTALTANSENYDNDSMHSTATNTSRITIQTAGRYLLSGTILYDNNATGARSVTFRKNGTTSYVATSAPNIGSTLDMGISGMRTLVLAAGDYVECLGYQNSGGALDATLQEFVALFLTR